MSKRPTFRELIVRYGNFSYAAGEKAARLQAGGRSRLPGGDYEEGDRLLSRIERALRKAGVPLDQVAP